MSVGLYSGFGRRRTIGLHLNIQFAVIKQGIVCYGRSRDDGCCAFSRIVPIGHLTSIQSAAWSFTYPSDYSGHNVMMELGIDFGHRDGTKATPNWTSAVG